MADETFSEPVNDSTSKVEGEVSVGENLDFQRKWWRFERIVWSFFVVILICDVLGLFGRGWLAKARRSTPDGLLRVDYERIERASTPSTMTLHFGAGAIHGGHIQVYVSDSVVKSLGARHVSPQPAVSAVGERGITYTFDATKVPAVVDISLEPSFPGVRRFRIQLAGDAPIDGRVLVMP